MNGYVITAFKRQSRPRPRSGAWVRFVAPPHSISLLDAVFQRYVVHSGAPDCDASPLAVVPPILGLPVHRNTYVHDDQGGDLQNLMKQQTAAVLKLRILVVDDDDVLRRWLCTQLEPRGFRVWEESQGDEALAAYLNHGPWDFVLSDLYFFRGEKIRNGLELVQAIRAVCPEQPMAIQTSEPGVNAPCALLRKPYTLGALLKVLRKPVTPLRVKGDPQIPGKESGGKMSMSVRTDRVGKLFIVLQAGMRRCLICDEVFTNQEAAKHSQVRCVPADLRSMRLRT